MSNNIENFDEELKKGFCELGCNWALVVMGAWNDIGYGTKVSLFNDEWFQKEGLAIAIMLHYIEYTDLDKYEWIKDTLGGFIPMGNAKGHFRVDYLTNSFVIHDNQQIDVTLLDPEFREQVVRNYLEPIRKPEEVFQILSDLSKNNFQMKPGRHDND